MCSKSPSFLLRFQHIFSRKKYVPFPGYNTTLRTITLVQKEHSFNFCIQKPPLYTNLNETRYLNFENSYLRRFGFVTILICDFLLHNRTITQTSNTNGSGTIGENKTICGCGKHCCTTMPTMPSNCNHSEIKTWIRLGTAFEMRPVRDIMVHMLSVSEVKEAVWS